jgi:GGDEF domain-containing protein
MNLVTAYFARSQERSQSDAPLPVPLGLIETAESHFPFVIEKGAENSRAIAEAFRTDVEQLRFEPHQDAAITIRLAIAVAPEDGKTPDELWGKATSVVYCHPSERRRNQVA